MKRLTIYFLISLLFNILILSIVFYKNKDNKTVASASQKNIVTQKNMLLPADIISRERGKPKPAEVKRQVSQYRSNKSVEGEHGGVMNNKDSPVISENDHKKRMVVEIPDTSEKKPSFITHEHYKRYKEKRSSNGVPITEIRVNFPDKFTESTMKEIIAYFGLKIVAYPSYELKFLIVGEPPNYHFDVLRKKHDIEKFYKENSNRTIELQTNEYLSWIKGRLKNQSISSKNLRIALALGRSSGYFHWKETLVAEELSMSVDKIRYLETRFFRTPQNYWILLVEGVGLNNGKYVSVKDRELEDILTL